MIVKRLFEPLLAQNSYLIGCAATGQAIVIDPNRDVDTYLAAAAAAHVTITHVTETHIHADFLSGRIRPGLDLHVPLSGMSYYVSSVVGLSVTWTR